MMRYYRKWEIEEIFKEMYANSALDDTLPGFIYEASKISAYHYFCDTFNIIKRNSIQIDPYPEDADYTAEGIPEQFKKYGSDQPPYRCCND